MSAGTTYFIVAVAGNPGAGGQIDWTDPCWSHSQGTPVTFHNPPTASMSGDTSICRGGSYVFKVKFQGEPPFTFKYAINGISQAPITVPSLTFNFNTTNVQQQQVYTLLTVENAYCTGTVNGTVNVKVLEYPFGELVGDSTICAGDSAHIRLHLTGANAFYVDIKGGDSPIHFSNAANGNTFTVSPTVTTTYVIDSLSAIGNHCPFLVGPSATVQVSAVTLKGTVSDFHGYNVSCSDLSDGYIHLSADGSGSPFQVLWNTGAGSDTIEHLAPGHYAVTVTNSNGCSASEEFNLNAPAPLAFEIKSKNPDCRNPNKGVITLVSAAGGTLPYTLSINGSVEPVGSLPAVYDQLPDGDYTLELTDANGCTEELSAKIATPAPPLVSLGPDITLFPGDSIPLQVNLQISKLDTFWWAPTQFMTGFTTLNPFVKPDRNISYSLTVVDSSGCRASDQINISIQKKPRIYLPNVIHPNAPNQNGVFTVYAGHEVSKVLSMRLYDRWGELMFEKYNFPVNDPTSGWDGKFRGQEVNPGVYVYVIEVALSLGGTEIITGDVTVIR
jgi:gliding motility-associated-like protein